MALHAAVSCTAAAIGDVFGFMAARWIHTTGIIGVRRELDSYITTLAREKLGDWTAQSIGFQCSLVLANPVSSMLGSLVWTCISEAVQSGLLLIAGVIGIYRQRAGRLRTMILTGVRIA